MGSWVYSWGNVERQADVSWNLHDESGMATLLQQFRVTRSLMPLGDYMHVFLVYSRASLVHVQQSTHLTLSSQLFVLGSVRFFVCIRDCDAVVAIIGPSAGKDHGVHRKTFTGGRPVHKISICGDHARIHTPHATNLAERGVFRGIGAGIRLDVSVPTF